jgi:signal transduction histidine kinase
LASETIRSEQVRQAQHLEVLGRIAASVAHDFSNVLTGVLLHAGKLLSELEPQGPLRRSAEEIQRAGERGARLAKQLAAYAQPAPRQVRPVNLNPIVKALRARFERLWGDRLEVIAECDPRLDAVQADAYELEQALLNLAVNAHEAMPAGGTLMLRTSNHAPAELDFAQEFICCEVEDTGCGMDSETRRQAFAPFFTTKDPGRGLGLTAVKDFAENCGGLVKLASEPGQGTRVRLLLPRGGAAGKSKQNHRSWGSGEKTRS